jgi:multiple sugar transport system substrate-binding protein
MKRVISLLLALVVVLSALTACSSGSKVGKPADSKPLNMTLWLPPFATGNTMDKAFWVKQLAPFEKDNNVNLSIEITPWGNYEQKYLTAVTANSGPDVGYMYVPMLADHIKMGTIAPLDSYLTAEDKTNYLYLNYGKTNGIQYALPFVVGNPRLLYCNMDILGKSGFTEPPKTWDEFVQVGQAVLKDSPDKYAFIQDWAEPSIGALDGIYYPFLWQAGGELFNQDGTKTAFDSPQGVEAVQFLYDLKFKYHILPAATTSMKDADVLNSMLAGKTAMAIMGSSSATQLDKKGINWKAIASLTKEKSATFLACDCLVMLNKSKNKNMDWKLMKFITSASVMTQFHAQLCMFPPLVKGEVYADNPKLADIYKNQAGSFQTVDNVTDSDKVLDPLYKNLQLMMLGQITPQKALDDSKTNAEAVGK